MAALPLDGLVAFSHLQFSPGELPEMVIEPSHDGLDDVVQDLERDRGLIVHLEGACSVALIFMMRPTRMPSATTS